MPIHQLFLDASLLVQLIMLLLFGLSILSWSLIYAKRKQMREMRRVTERFEERFWSGTSIIDLYQSISNGDNKISHIERIFETGFSEFMRLHKKTKNTAHIISATEKAMRVTLSRESSRVNTYLDFFATVGASSPYIGLLGTVWGIMNAFRALTQANQVTLKMVAPGIAEALIATALGLIAAIPAVIAYNRFRQESENILSHYDNFIVEFCNLLSLEISIKDGSS